MHHSAIYSNPKTVYFFDSFALPPTLEIIEKFNHTKNRICGDNEEQIQTFDKKYCGQMALYFLHRINKGDTFDDILEQLK